MKRAAAMPELIQIEGGRPILVKVTLRLSFSHVLLIIVSVISSKSTWPILHAQGKEVWLMKLRGIDSPEAADVLKGQRLLMHAEERPSLDSDDEYYVQELVGMKVGSRHGGVVVVIITILWGTTHKFQDCNGRLHCLQCCVCERS